jgi:hypothetical protein
MGKFVATLIGKLDGHASSRHFENLNSAIAWVRGAGLTAFDDQSARAEVSEDGRLVWTQTHLQSREYTETEMALDNARHRRWLDKMGLKPNWWRR